MRTKHLFISFLSLFLFAFLAPQVKAQVTAAKVVVWTEQGSLIDTTSETLTWEKSINGTVDKTQLWDYDLVFKLDSVSGTSNVGTLKLQTANDAAGTAAASVIWYDLSTTVIDGTANQILHFNGTITGRRFRVVLNTTSTSTSVLCDLRGILRKRTQ